MKTIALQNEIGKIVEVKLGFSWTTLLLSYIPDLYRGNFKAPAKILACNIFFVVMFVAIDAGALSSLATFGVFIYYAMTRNKGLIEHYFTQGFKIIDGVDTEVNEYLGYEISDGMWK